MCHCCTEDRQLPGQAHHSLLPCRYLQENHLTELWQEGKCIVLGRTGVTGSSKKPWSWCHKDQVCFLSPVWMTLTAHKRRKVIRINKRNKNLSGWDMYQAKGELISCRRETVWEYRTGKCLPGESHYHCIYFVYLHDTSCSSGSFWGVGIVPVDSASVSFLSSKG